MQCGGNMGNSKVDLNTMMYYITYKKCSRERRIEIHDSIQLRICFAFKYTTYQHTARDTIFFSYGDRIEKFKNARAHFLDFVCLKNIRQLNSKSATRIFRRGGKIS